jgi:hypothetical protein
MFSSSGPVASQVVRPIGVASPDREHCRGFAENPAASGSKVTATPETPQFNEGLGMSNRLLGRQCTSPLFDQAAIKIERGAIDGPIAGINGFRPGDAPQIEVCLDLQPPPPSCNAADGHQRSGLPGNSNFAKLFEIPIRIDRTVVVLLKASDAAQSHQRGPRESRVEKSRLCADILLPPQRSYGALTLPPRRPQATKGMLPGP